MYDNRSELMSKVSGVVHLIEPTKTYGAKGFRKRTVVLEQDFGSFTNYIPMDFTKDNCDAVDSLHVGDEITVEYRLNGRKWQKDEASEVKFFLNAEGMSFDVERLANKPAAAGGDDGEETPF